MSAGIDIVMSYITVFEITHRSVPLWFPVAFVLFGLFGTISFLLTRNSSRDKRLFMSLILFFYCVWFAAAAYYLLNRKHEIEAYRNGKYKVVEGSVDHYSWTGKTECFTVHSIVFCHGTADLAGWDPPWRLGTATWPIGLAREGSRVRVTYVDRVDSHSILRLEIGRNSR